MDISFVCTTRNDGYGGEVVPGRNFTIDRLALTCHSIRRLEEETGTTAEILIVEYNPPMDKPRIRELLHGYRVRIISLDPHLHELLLEDNKPIVVPFYEYIGKDIGIRNATHEQVIAFNPDNIFPTYNWHHIERDIKNEVVLGYRLDIDRNYIKKNYDYLIQEANDRTIPFEFISISAMGDFIGFTKSLYEVIGRYPMLHGGWGIDCELVHIAGRKGIPVSRYYVHYHINHDNSISEIRYPTNYDKYKKIDDNIVNNLDKFITEDVYVA